MLKEKELSSPSLEEASPLDAIPAEAQYHETDVFGREEDHDVRQLLFLPESDSTQRFGASCMV